MNIRNKIKLIDINDERKKNNPREIKNNKG